MFDQTQPQITSLGLRNHANALYPPNKQQCRDLLLHAAGELERTRADLVKSSGQVEALRVECERLLMENSLLRERNATLSRDAEMSSWVARRVARIATRGVTP